MKLGSSYFNMSAPYVFIQKQPPIALQIYADLVGGHIIRVDGVDRTATQSQSQASISTTTPMVCNVSDKECVLST